MAISSDEPFAFRDHWADFQKWEPPPFLIENLLPSGGSILLHGQPRAGKSLIALEILVALATGTPAFHSARLAVPRRVACLYVCGEDRLIHVHDRVRALLGSRGLSEPPTNLHAMFAGHFSLDDDAWVEWLASYCDTNEIKIVCFDPLRRLTEHADQGPGELMPVMRRLRRLTNISGAQPMLVHHDVKPFKRDSARRDLPQLASGGGIFSVSDAPVHVRRIGQGRIQLTPAAYKFGPDPDRFTVWPSFEQAPGQPLSIRLGEYVASRAASGDDLATRILARLARGPATSGSALVRELHANKRRALALLEELKSQGKVQSAQNGRSTVWALTPPEPPRAEGT